MLSNNVESICKPAYPFVSSPDSVINISKPLKFALTNSRSIDFITSTFCVFSHRNIHLKRKFEKV